MWVQRPYGRQGHRTTHDPSPNICQPKRAAEVDPTVQYDFAKGQPIANFQQKKNITRTQVQELGPRAGTKNCALMIIM